MVKAYVALANLQQLREASKQVQTASFLGSVSEGLRMEYIGHDIHIHVDSS